MVEKVLKMGMLAMVLVFGLMVAGCDLFETDNSARTVTGIVATLIQGTNPNQDSIHITWFAASAATRYEIAYRTNMDSLDTRRNVRSSHDNTTYTHTGFIRNQGTLVYYVRAHGTTTDGEGRRTPWTGPWAMSSEVEVRQ